MSVVDNRIAVIIPSDLPSIGIQYRSAEVDRLRTRPACKRILGNRSNACGNVERRQGRTVFKCSFADGRQLAVDDDRRNEGIFEHTERNFRAVERDLGQIRTACKHFAVVRNGMIFVVFVVPRFRPSRTREGYVCGDNHFRQGLTAVEHTATDVFRRFGEGEIRQRLTVQEYRSIESDAVAFRGLERHRF